MANDKKLIVKPNVNIYQEGNPNRLMMGSIPTIQLIIIFNYVIYHVHNMNPAIAAMIIIIILGTVTASFITLGLSRETM